MPAALTKRRKPAKVADEVVFVSDISHWFLKKLRLTGPFSASLHFRDDLIAEIDFEKWVKSRSNGSLLSPLADERYFQQVFIDHGVLTWPNGFDLAPDTVRHWAEQGFCG
jgi:hypothetical protein